MKNLGLLVLPFVGSVFAIDTYFTNSTRAEIFQKTDLKVGNLTINLNKDDFKNYFLTYQCMHDTNVRYHVRNDDCYTAPWIDLDDVFDKAVKKSLITKEMVTDTEDLALFDKKNITIGEFEHLFTNYTNHTMEDIFSSTNSFFSIPLFETENASMTLNVDG
ncbi:hypothetical protein PIROE2DRAFT_62493 [Piromyces sp. E2]|nr:hypothetical protein PIROE2DRAFT_62493 [Piromyces sp. E2]|eukprot:OUM61439.1 hypothetical protein PIROE2DRAFT_62493 [Piromyces sp. E2]